MNDFDKTFVFTLLILFRNKIKLWQRKYVNFKYMEFSKEDVV